MRPGGLFGWNSYWPAKDWNTICFFSTNVLLQFLLVGLVRPDCPPLTRPKFGYTTCKIPNTEPGASAKETNCAEPVPAETEAVYSCKKHYLWASSSLDRHRFCNADGLWTAGTPYACKADCGLRGESSSSSLFIVGGAAAKGAEYPWHAALYSKLASSKEKEWEFICGGTLVTERAILTAAHCLKRTQESSGGFLEPSELKVFLGKIKRNITDNDDFAQSLQTLKIIIHPQYISTGHASGVSADIALIIFKKPAVLTDYVRPACLPFQDRRLVAVHLSESSVGHVAGWGKNATGQLADSLIGAQLPYISYKKCHNYLKQFNAKISDAVYCSEFTNGSTVCSGDSGGGMVFPEKDGLNERWFLQGIVSHAYDKSQANCVNGSYSVFTKVSYYESWISRELVPFSGGLQGPERPLATDDSGGFSVVKAPVDAKPKIPNSIIEKWPYDYAKVLELSILFYEAQKSGKLPPTNRIKYRGDSGLTDYGLHGEDLIGGYYDGVSLIKYSFPTAATFTVITWGAILYKDAYARTNQLAYVYDIIKWAVEYFIKAHIEDHKVYAMVGYPDVDYAYWGRPEDMSPIRPSFYIDENKPGSELAGEISAFLAAASILFEKDDTFMAFVAKRHAKILYDFATKFRGDYQYAHDPPFDDYKSWNGYYDELLWASAWLYKATNDTKYLQEAERHYIGFNLSKRAHEFTWDDKLVGAQILLYEATKNESYREKIQEFCNYSIKEIPRTPKGLAYFDLIATLRHATNRAFISLLAAGLGIDPAENLKFAKEQIHYALGSSGRSYVVGFGVNYPLRPFHKAASCPNRPAKCGWDQHNAVEPNPQILWGALVGGPFKDDQYEDLRRDTIRSRTCLEFNSGFQSAVAGLIQNSLDTESKALKPRSAEEDSIIFAES